VSLDEKSVSCLFFCLIMCLWCVFITGFAQRQMLKLFWVPNLS